jgi:hypothetical protein
VIALIFTALLGIAGYVVQSKNATAADRAQHEIVQEAADLEQTRGLAAIQLERVRSQMAEALMPLNSLLSRADFCGTCMGWELRIESMDIWGVALVRPFRLWPHIEVMDRDLAVNRNLLNTFKGSVYSKYSPAEIALLEDPAKRQIYIEAYTGCMAPCYREVATILTTKGHLLQRPPPTFLDGIFPDGVADWTKFLGGSLIWLQFEMCAFADAWAPLERRWEAGDFSRMQPAPPNPGRALAIIVTSMQATAGARQHDLEGASSMSGRKNAAIDSVSGVAASTQDDT